MRVVGFALGAGQDDLRAPDQSMGQGVRTDETEQLGFPGVVEIDRCDRAIGDHGWTPVGKPTRNIKDTTRSARTRYERTPGTS